MHWQPFTWRIPRKDRVFIEDGVVRPGKTVGDYVIGSGRYDPFSHSNLPNALAKVQDEADVVNFVQSYGLLGYSPRLLFGPKPRELAQLYDAMKGDPVDWVLAHARTVRFALRLLHALQYPGDGLLLDVLQEEWRPFEGPPDLDDPEVTRGFAALEKGGIVGRFGVALGAETTMLVPVTVLPEHAGRPEATRAVAQELLVLMVSSNTVGVTQSLTVRNGTFGVQRRATSLIEVIWYHVGEMALIQQHAQTTGEDNGKAIRTCEECGSPFLVTDQRERFCPSPFGGPSLCASRNRQRRYRQRLREKQKEGS